MTQPLMLVKVTSISIHRPRLRASLIVCVASVVMVMAITAAIFLPDAAAQGRSNVARSVLVVWTTDCETWQIASYPAFQLPPSVPN
jgi:hypothetical protein